MTIKDKVIGKIQSLGQEYTIIGRELKTLCINPDHNDSSPSYYINLVDAKNHCFSCGFALKPENLLDINEEDTEELLRVAKYNQLSDTLKASEATVEPVEFSLPPKDYSINKDWRGVSQELLEALGVYYTSKGRFAGRLVFPIKYSDDLVGFDARIVNPKVVPDKLLGVKWLRPKGMVVQDIVYPYDYLKGMDCSHVVITEGVADCVSYLELGIPAIPNFGVSPPNPARITKMLELGVTTVTLGFDNDEAGRVAATKVFKHYIEWFQVKSHLMTYKVFKSGEKDCNDYLKKIKGV